tara:strand:+ start:6322 stop:7731 length:1410 start_codon:yes stop_codon:yes gene_type:complete
MKIKIQYKAIIISLLSLVLMKISYSASLLEVYQRALQSDPMIHEAESRRLAALEGETQARSWLLPELSVGSRYSINNFDGSSVEAGAAGSIASVTSQSKNINTGWQLQLTQSVFQWDRWVGLKQAGKRSAKAEIDYEIAQQDLIIRVVTRYLDVLAAEDNLVSVNSNKLSIARQLEQAKKRFEVGLIAITAVQESQAAYDQIVAGEINAKRSLATARELLREITGAYLPKLNAPDDTLPLKTPNPEVEAEWIALAMQQNLRLISNRFDEEIARHQISFERTGHYPSLNVVANLGAQDSDTEDQIRNSINFPNISTSNQSDSITLQVSIPLYSGGKTSSKVQEAVYLHRASREKLQRVARETERETRDTYLGVTSEISRVKALGQAVKSSKTALEATQAGFEVGTRTIVDVLNSQFALEAANKNHAKSRYDYIANVFRLKKAAGSLRVQDIEEIDVWLKERPSPEEILTQ